MVRNKDVINFPAEVAIVINQSLCLTLIRGQMLVCGKAQSDVDR